MENSNHDRELEWSAKAREQIRQLEAMRLVVKDAIERYTPAKAPRVKLGFHICNDGNQGMPVLHWFWGDIDDGISLGVFIEDEVSDSGYRWKLYSGHKLGHLDAIGHLYDICELTKLIIDRIVSFAFDLAELARKQNN